MKKNKEQKFFDGMMIKLAQIDSYLYNQPSGSEMLMDNGQADGQDNAMAKDLDVDKRIEELLSIIPQEELLRIINTKGGGGNGL